MSAVINFPTEHLPEATVTRDLLPVRNALIKELQDQNKTINQMINGHYRYIEELMAAHEKNIEIMEAI